MDETTLDFKGTEAALIYEGGVLSKITGEELQNNPVAIRQLINAHNLLERKLSNKENDIQNARTEIEYLKTSPYVSIIAAILNIVGSVLIALSINLITSETVRSPSSKNNLILTCGIALIATGSLATILYPYARSWFNKK
jgi:hypothetical protein